MFSSNREIINSNNKIEKGKNFTNEVQCDNILYIQNYIDEKLRTNSKDDLLKIYYNFGEKIIYSENQVLCDNKSITNNIILNFRENGFDNRARINNAYYYNTQDNVSDNRVRINNFNHEHISKNNDYFLENIKNINKHNSGHEYHGHHYKRCKLIKNRLKDNITNLQ